ncbi:hypothetical protein TNCT_134881 [Trichonephila clavata]|uniref:Uncharacterized protein n=1 Tax=Trichonephila clavata TaxID=2740835 RepID=A0A8X6KK64_TRICU|nr:hypothetical protein TNCT_134881 [Trichonephila clavata]
MKTGYKYYKNLPGVPPQSIFGNIGWVLNIYTRKAEFHPGVYILQRITGYNFLHVKEGFHCVWFGPNPVITMFSPEVIEEAVTILFRAPVLRISVLFRAPVLRIPVLFRAPVLRIPVLFLAPVLRIPVLFRAPVLRIPVLFRAPVLRIPVVFRAPVLRIPVSFGFQCSGFQFRFGLHSRSGPAVSSSVFLSGTVSLLCVFIYSPA